MPKQKWFDDRGGGLMDSARRRAEEKRHREDQENVYFNEKTKSFWDRRTGEERSYVDEQGTLRHGRRPRKVEE